MEFDPSAFEAFDSPISSHREPSAPQVGYVSKAWTNAKTYISNAWKRIKGLFIRQKPVEPPKPSLLQRIASKAAGAIGGFALAHPLAAAGAAWYVTPPNVQDAAQNLAATGTERTINYLGKKAVQSFLPRVLQPPALEVVERVSAFGTDFMRTPDSEELQNEERQKEGIETRNSLIFGALIPGLLGNNIVRNAATSVATGLSGFATWYLNRRSGRFM